MRTRFKKGVFMKTYKLTLLCLGAMSFMAMAFGCSSGGQNSGSSSNTPAAVVYQNPTVACQVNMGNQTLLTISNLTSSAPGLFNPPKAPAAFSFNCMGSQAHSPNAVLSFAYSVNGGPMTAFSAGLADMNDAQLN